MRRTAPRMAFSLAAIFLLIAVAAVLLGTAQTGMSEGFRSEATAEGILIAGLCGVFAGALVGGIIGMMSIRWYAGIPAGCGIGALTGLISAIGLIVPGAVRGLVVGSVVLLAGGLLVRFVAWKNRPKELE